jgi:hypothetical protein
MNRRYPPLAAKKLQGTLRLDPVVLAGLRATGPGWQTKVNAALKAWLVGQKYQRVKAPHTGREAGTNERATRRRRAGTGG